MPTEFGAWSTVPNRFRQWRDAGVFEALLEKAAAEEEKARSKGAASKSKTGKRPKAIPRWKNDGASGVGKNPG